MYYFLRPRNITRVPCLPEKQTTNARASTGFVERRICNLVTIIDSYAFIAALWFAAIEAWRPRRFFRLK
jgi:hypothetical protein